MPGPAAARGRALQEPTCSRGAGGAAGEEPGGPRGAGSGGAQLPRASGQRERGTRAGKGRGSEGTAPDLRPARSAAPTGRAASPAPGHPPSEPAGSSAQRRGAGHLAAGQRVTLPWLSRGIPEKQGALSGEKCRLALPPTAQTQQLARSSSYPSNRRLEATKEISSLLTQAGMFVSSRCARPPISCEEQQPSTARPSPLRPALPPGEGRATIHA